MDIRNFLTGGVKRNLDDGVNNGSEERENKRSKEGTSNSCLKESESSTSVCLNEILTEYPENDLGKWVGQSSQLSVTKKKELLMCCWTPPANYNFKNDRSGSERKFNESWLKTYSPWLVYSKYLKGALCKFCVLFPPPINSVQGVLGAFMVKPFIRFKDVHESCRNHASNQWHKTAVKAAKAFTESVPVDLQLISSHQKLLEEKKKVLQSIISSILFCGMHDMPLRGKDKGGIFQDLINFRIDAGDQELKHHLEDSIKKNATYMSPTIQNEIIDLCGVVVKEEIIKDAQKAVAYSVLADETADISGKEQLSIGLRFFDVDKKEIREEFVGFVELPALDAVTIAGEIEKFLDKHGLDPEKCVGQGYDGCSTMAGKDGGVQAIIRKKYKKAMFFHCASHKLNLVINDLNAVAEIRNTVGTIKDVINFFRESVIRRKYAPNIPLLCETRWSQKHKSIRVFFENFEKIIQGLQKLSLEGNNSTRKIAFQLHAAATKSQFLVSMALIAKYSALMEPVVNILQEKSLDVLQCSRHIMKILEVIKTHRENIDDVSSEILEDCEKKAEEIDADFSLPRCVSRQKHRSNVPASSPSDYWKRSLIIPYLDSLTTSLHNRFSEEHSIAFALLSLHPSKMLGSSLQDFKKEIKAFQSFYDLEGLEPEVEVWYFMWKTKSQASLQDISLLSLLKETEMFFPSVRKALLICVAQPCTTCTVERSFSTLRRVKTWLRSTMTGDRLNGLCLISIHRKIVKEKKHLEEEILKRFLANPRKILDF